MTWECFSQLHGSLVSAWKKSKYRLISKNIPRDAFEWLLVNRPGFMYQYANMALRLSGQNCKFLSFFCLSMPKRDLGAKKTPLNIKVLPESLGAMLEY